MSMKKFILFLAVILFMGTLNSVFASVYTGPTGVIYSDFDTDGFSPSGFKDIHVECPSGFLGGLNSLKDGITFGGAHSCNNTEAWWMQDNMGVNGNTNDEQIADGHYCIYINGGDPSLCTHGEFDIMNGVFPQTPPPYTIDPVIVIPGIMGSAYKNGELVIDPILHTYDDLIATLDQNGYGLGVDLFTFPYEWRDPNSINANLLKDKITEVKNICNCDKVDLVAHSMGGLVAREYIQSGQYQDDVDQVIFLGTPHKGSPKAYLQWEAGEFPAGRILDLVTKTFFQTEALENGYTSLFDYIHNRPVSSVQELLPIFDYLKDKDTGTIRTYSTNYPINIFLEALNLNSKIQSFLTSGVKITNIVGNAGSASTINTIRVGSSSSPLWAHGKPDGFDGQTADRGLEKGTGDGTVTLSGASLDSSIPNEEVIGDHIKLPTVAENRVFNILTNQDSTTNIDSNPSTDYKILILQLLSPVDFVVIAPDGKKIGKNFANGQEYDEIPDAFYSGYDNDDDEYITIPNPLDGEYKIEVQGTGSGGEYRVLTSYISEEFDITTETTGITQPSQITKLEVVVDNDNPEELNTEREVTLEVLINDVNGAYNLGWITDKKVRDSLIKQAKLIIRFEKKRNGKYEVKIDKILIKLLEKELDLLKKRGKINQQAYGLLKVDLKYLINNN